MRATILRSLVSIEGILKCASIIHHEFLYHHGTLIFFNAAHLLALPCGLQDQQRGQGSHAALLFGATLLSQELLHCAAASNLEPVGEESMWETEPCTEPGGGSRAYNLVKSRYGSRLYFPQVIFLSLWIKCKYFYDSLAFDSSIIILYYYFLKYIFTIFLLSF